MSRRPGFRHRVPRQPPGERRPPCHSAAAVRPDHRGALRAALVAGMAAHRAEVDADRGRPEPADLRQHRRRDRVVRAAAGRPRGRLRQPGRSTSPRRDAGDRERRSPRWRPPTWTRSGWTRPCSPGSTPCMPPATSRSGRRAVRLVERYHLDFVLAGAQLDEPGRARLSELNQRSPPSRPSSGSTCSLRRRPPPSRRGRRPAGRTERRAGSPRRRPPPPNARPEGT